MHSGDQDSYALKIHLTGMLKEMVEEAEYADYIELGLPKSIYGDLTGSDLKELLAETFFEDFDSFLDQWELEINGVVEDKLLESSDLLKLIQKADL